MNTYTTAQIARMIGIHPNTVRLYEKLELIPAPKRRANGYRIFTDLHIEQFRLARTVLQVEVLQNGLRKQAIEIIKTSAAGDFDGALRLVDQYIQRLKTERDNAEEAIAIASQLLSGHRPDGTASLLTRKAAADELEVTIDTLRNWEMNGLLTVRRRQNGYRVYSDEDMRRLKLIRALRCANYSLAAILRMLNALSRNPEINIRHIIDTPGEDDDVISVCDKLISSLTAAIQNAKAAGAQLERMKQR